MYYTDIQYITMQPVYTAVCTSALLLKDKSLLCTVLESYVHDV